MSRGRVCCVSFLVRRQDMYTADGPRAGAVRLRRFLGTGERSIDGAVRWAPVGPGAGSWRVLWGLWALWFCGPVVLWPCGSVALWTLWPCGPCGPVDPVGLWSLWTLWVCGSCGPVVPVDPVALWTLWPCGPVALWPCGPVVPVALWVLWVCCPGEPGGLGVLEVGNGWEWGRKMRPARGQARGVWGVVRGPCRIRCRAGRPWARRPRWWCSAGILRGSSCRCCRR